eukprot:731760-Hanusia_phi.AAC.1
MIRGDRTVPVMTTVRSCRRGGGVRRSGAGQCHCTGYAGDRTADDLDLIICGSAHRTVLPGPGPARPGTAREYES